MPSKMRRPGWNDLGQAAVDRPLASPGHAQWRDNGKRPASGSFAVEDDGVSPRTLGSIQWKKGLQRWFFWEATDCFDFQTKSKRVDVWTNANTRGTDERFDESVGRTGFNYSNGDGVLLYPGTDKLFPAGSLGANGPMASLRMKYRRRGVQDADYIAMAHAVDAARTEAIVQRMVPRGLWEVGVQEASDPTWKRTDISWPIDPDACEAARKELGDIIESRVPREEADAAGDRGCSGAAPRPRFADRQDRGGPRHGAASSSFFDMSPAAVPQRVTLKKILFRSAYYPH
ncbi:MAG: DUF4091 domain-containing protein [Steroidobacteraceae bacterium]|nr:DUF4091 domain-containing protein [Steroidobacteraceae bacterium]